MNQLYTRWNNIDKDNVLLEYPRPQMRRDSYINLNGYWDYAINDSDKLTDIYEGKILVPFSPESSLSEVNRVLQPNDYLHYHRTVMIDDKMLRNRVLLHFGAVDQICWVYVNGKLVGEHIGGYLPFHFDITDKLVCGENTLQVVVKDYSDTSFHSRGKQMLKHGGMYYTPQSGIWQTVWMECVPNEYIESIKITPLFDQNQLAITINTNGIVEKSKVIVKDKDKKIVEKEIDTNIECIISLPDTEKWTPDNPYLYDLEIVMEDDVIESYFGMRKVAIEKDSNGILRTTLNNKPYFHNGLLDQGYWPEGLYTAPSDDALIYDINKMKELGYNILRKHCKVECARWYYHCDCLGMLVWQDMVNGGEKYNSNFVTILPNVITPLGRLIKDNKYKLFARNNKEGREQYYKELKEMIEHLYNHPSLVVWVPFNEGWGQFDATMTTEFIRGIDNTRLIDEASGWFDQGGGDLHSIHNYFFKLKVKPSSRVVALTEYGGYSYRVESHSYCDKVYGYRKYYSKEELTSNYAKLINREILPNISNGLSVAIYTQVSDVEEEVNGLLTYDREIVKIDEKEVRLLNEKLYQVFKKATVE